MEFRIYIHLNINSKKNYYEISFYHSVMFNDS
jgi:hypothetical protein